MRKMKGTISLVLSMVLCLTMCMPLSANEGCDILSPTPPVAASEISPRGANPPASSADIHDLSTSAYNYQVLDVGYQVFSSKWITGASSIQVTVNNWKLLEYYIGATSNKVTISVYNSRKELVDSDTITIYDKSGLTYLSGLTETEKYYVGVQVPTNGNRYKFNGTISKY